MCFAALQHKSEFLKLVSKRANKLQKSFMEKKYDRFSGFQQNATAVQCFAVLSSLYVMSLIELLFFTQRGFVAQ
jgi:hypothetical protein